MLFVDGVGIGENDPSKNIFFQNEFTFIKNNFSSIPHLENQFIEQKDKYIFPVDACLGMEGLPQSGTGQTSIFTGINAPQFIGKHFGPYPYSTLVPEIKEKNILKSLKQKGKSVVFANAYPKIFFDYINSGKKRLSVTSLSCLLSDIKLKNPTDLRRGKALSAEIDNYRWVEKLNYQIPVIKPETAAKRLLKLSSENDFTLFEYFYTDHFGHGRYPEIKDHTLKTFNSFLNFLFKNIPSNTTLYFCSDHGNIEDLSTKSHTRNPSLSISIGAHSKFLRDNIKDLTHIKPAIMELLM